MIEVTAPKVSIVAIVAKKESMKAKINSDPLRKLPPTRKMAISQRVWLNNMVA
jgi:hypothetical protein